MINTIDLTKAGHNTDGINLINNVTAARKAVEQARPEQREQEQDKLNALLAQAKDVDAANRAAAIAAEKERLLTAYAANPCALLTNRVFDETGAAPKPIDGTAVYPSIIKTVSTDGETMTAAAIVSIHAAQLVTPDARKELRKHARRLERLAMRYHYDSTDADTVRETNTIVCDIYRIFGANGLKPRRSGKHSDIVDILRSIFNSNRKADADTVRETVVINKVEDYACASIQHRVAKDAAAARFAKEDKQEQERANRAAEKAAKAAEKAKAGKATDKAVKVTAAEKAAVNA
ncbi:MAG: hypothetical protein IJG15_05225 [Lachnospiraceae bacterium]|nr:hypothetical protein [Lachnospiraceae bacterium]